MKVTQMPPVHAVNLVANGGNTAYGVDVIDLNPMSNRLNRNPFSWIHVVHGLTEISTCIPFIALYKV